MSVARALRALARFRAAESAPTQAVSPPAVRLTPTLPVVDPPPESVAPIGDPPRERTVEIPLFLEP